MCPENISLKIYLLVVKVLEGHFVLYLIASSLLKAMVASLPEPGQVPSTYTGLTLLTPVASLLGVSQFW